MRRAGLPRQSPALTPTSGHSPVIQTVRSGVFTRSHAGWAATASGSFPTFRVAVTFGFVAPVRSVAPPPERTGPVRRTISLGRFYQAPGDQLRRWPGAERAPPWGDSERPLIIPRSGTHPARQVPRASSGSATAWLVPS